MMLAVAGYQQYCKCQCSTNSLVAKIDKCIECTAQWCLQQKSDLCPGDNTNNMLVSCFQLQSIKEKFLVVGFIIAVALLVCRSLLG